MDLADASLVILAEELGSGQILSGSSVFVMQWTYVG